MNGNGRGQSLMFSWLLATVNDFNVSTWLLNTSQFCWTTLPKLNNHFLGLVPLDYILSLLFSVPIYCIICILDCPFFCPSHLGMLCTGNNNNQDSDSEPVNRKINLKHLCWVQPRSTDLARTTMLTLKLWIHMGSQHRESCNIKALFVWSPKNTGFLVSRRVLK